MFHGGGCVGIIMLCEGGCEWITDVCVGGG